MSQDASLPPIVDELITALRLLLDDAEASHADYAAHAMAITNPDHPWHESIMAARAALDKAE